jgi:hypothetical protein
MHLFKPKDPQDLPIAPAGLEQLTDALLVVEKH